jgi:hypothetical protein
MGFERVIRKHDCWKLFLRYQAQTERLYRRAIEDLDRIKTLRRELPNAITSDLPPLLPREELNVDPDLS